MAQTSYFGDTITVSLKTVETTPVTLVVGVLKGVEIKAEWEHVELYGQDSVKRECVARKNLKVSVNAKSAKFHASVIGEILGTLTLDKDVEGAAATGYTAASIADSNTVPLFTLTGTLTGCNAEVYTAKVTNVYWEGAPWSAPDGEYSAIDLTGFGDDLILGYKTV
jgi:hypothetical protein